MSETIESEVKTTDKKFIDVLERLSEVIDNQGRPQAAPLPAAPAPEKPNIYSRAELDNMVVEQKISQDQADEILERQNDYRIASVAEEIVDNRIKTRDVLGEIERYKKSIPNMMKEGSIEREKLVREYRTLVATGQPDSQSTELAAVKIAFGNIDAVEAAHKGTAPREFHQDVDTGEASKSGEKSPLAGLPARHRDYYRQQIDKGFYAGENDKELLEEIKYLKKRA